MSSSALLLTPAASGLLRQAALVEGFEGAGYTVTPFEGWRSTRSPDLAICSGMRNNSLKGRNYCRSRGIDIAVVELGYLRRANSNADLEGYFQLGWNRIGWLPEKAPEDRWKALGMGLEPIRNGGEYVLVLGQVGFDAQHGLSTHELAGWLLRAARQTAVELQKPVLYRPHPLQPNTRLSPGFPHKQMNVKTTTLEQALDRAAAVVTYNSTAAVEAIRCGVRVVCAPTAHFHQVGADLTLREDYFQRLAYAQWTLEELRSGEAVRFILAQRA